MAIFLLAAFIGVPLVEIAVFIQIGGWIGLMPTLALVVLTAVLGTWQLRAQGLATLLRARDQVDRGALPARELFDGACLLVAGALLLTPGFVTDTAGFLLFLPLIRDKLRVLLAHYVQSSMQARSFAEGGEGAKPGGSGRPGGAQGPIIDGEFRDVTDTAPPEHPPRQGRLPE
jgi:UPF0716 protein FxsA